MARQAPLIHVNTMAALPTYIGAAVGADDRTSRPADLRGDFVPWSTIHKVGAVAGLAPNLSNYEATCRSFSWRAARGDLDGLAGGGLNIAYEAVDRHVARGRGDHRAIVWIGKSDAVRNYSYADLAVASNRFANVLRNLGVDRGERVFALAGRIPGALRGRARNLESWRRLLSAVFRLRTRSHPPAHEHRARPASSSRPRRCTARRSCPGGPRWATCTTCY